MELDNFTIVDGAVAIIIVISALLAFSRGLVREVMSILGWVVAAFVAFTFAPQVEPLVLEIPILKDLIGTSCELSILVAFAAVFGVALIIVSIFTPLLSGMVANSALGPMDQGLGFLFGVARADFKERLETMIPEDAPGWVAAQYEKLTGGCGN